LYRFGQDVLEAMLDFISTLVESTPQLALNMPILDVGTGNGVLPIHLAKRGFGHVTGSDYSRAAVDLCADVASAEGVEGVTFVLDDVLQSTLPDR
jgi:2-polyprenyl-3-methyl-5-hydroxy-6-metoxy-1,4-benzoquinol methylase